MKLNQVIKNHFKEKLGTWLGTESFSEEKQGLIESINDALQSTVDSVNRELELANKSILDLKNELLDIRNLQESFENTLENAISIGTNVGYPEGGDSWGVICIRGLEGKSDNVQFFDFTGGNYLDIIEALKPFKHSNKIIDSPFKPMFIEGIEDYKVIRKENANEN